MNAEGELLKTRKIAKEMSTMMQQSAVARNCCAAFASKLDQRALGGSLSGELEQ